MPAGFWKPRFRDRFNTSEGMTTCAPAHTPQEIRDRQPSTSITIVHANKRVLNPDPAPKPATGPAQSYNAPSTAPKLSAALEKELADLKIDLVLGDKVAIPADPAGLASAEDWDGSFGKQAGMKRVKLQSGKTLEADYVFVSVGNRPGSGLVKETDEGAVVDGMVWVDEYLRVSKEAGCIGVEEKARYWIFEMGQVVHP